MRRGTAAVSLAVLALNHDYCVGYELRVVRFVAIEKHVYITTGYQIPRLDLRMLLSADKRPVVSF